MFLLLSTIEDFKARRRYLSTTNLSVTNLPATNLPATNLSATKILNTMPWNLPWAYQQRQQEA
jgi:hypothetical protein